MFLIIVFMIGLVNAELYYNVEIRFESQIFYINDVSVEFSNLELNNILDEELSDTHKIKVIDNYDNVLNELEYSFLNYLEYDSKDSKEIIYGGLLDVNNGVFNVYIPYNEDAREIRIYDENNRELVKKDVSEYSKIDINDNVERYDNDIRIREVSEKNSIIYFIIGIIIILFIIIITYHLIKKFK